MSTLKNKMDTDTITYKSTYMNPSSLIRLTFAGIVLAGLSMSVPTLRADDNGSGCTRNQSGCNSCPGMAKAKASPSPSGSGSTNAPAK